MRGRKGQPGGMKPPVRNPTCGKQAGQTTVFFALILTGLLLLTAVGIEIGRIVYARGEVGKAADAAALAAAARIDVPHYRETGEVRFLSDARSTAQNFASMNSTFLLRRHISVTVTGISINSASRQVSVKVAADLSSLTPAILPFQGVYSVIGYAEARVGNFNILWQNNVIKSRHRSY